MKRIVLKVFKPIICAIVVVLIGSYVLPIRIQAQATAPACDVDLSQATVLMTRAQAKASSGDTAGAMALLDQVTQAISDIKTRCGGSGTSVELSQSFKEPSGAFTVSYPKGWVNRALPGGSDSQEHAILFASDSSVYNALTHNTPFGTGQGIVVYVGTAKEIVTELGAFNSDKTYDSMTPTSLLGAIIAGESSSSTKLGAAEKTAPIGNYQTAESSFTGLDPNSSNVIAKGTLMVMKIADDQFALLFSLAGPGQEGSVEPLARSMAATIQVPPAK